MIKTYHGDLTKLKTEVEAILISVNQMLKREEQRRSMEVTATKPADIGDIVIHKACDMAHMKEEALLARTRKGKIILYRKVLCYILTDHCFYPTQKAADRLNYENHATVMHHRDEMRYWMSYKKSAQKDALKIAEELLKVVYHDKEKEVA